MRGCFYSTHFAYTRGNTMTKVNDFDVQRFDSCLRAALYEKFISNDMGKDNDEIINSTNGRAFIKRSDNKCRNYKKRPTLLCLDKRSRIGRKESLKKIVTQKTNDENKRLRKKNNIDKACDLIKPQWAEINREYEKCRDPKAIITIAFGILSCALKQSEVALFANIINFAIDYFIFYKKQI